MQFHVIKSGLEFKPDQFK